MEIVLNSCFGGFSLSEIACKKLGLINPYAPIGRTDPRLIECVRTLGEEANGNCASLRIVEIPNDCTDWEINDYDGVETITYVVGGQLYHI